MGTAGSFTIWSRSTSAFQVLRAVSPRWREVPLLDTGVRLGDFSPPTICGNR
jgi:hypothetical protein